VLEGRLVFVPRHEGDEHWYEFSGEGSLTKFFGGMEPLSKPLTQREVQGLVRRAARRANLRNVGVHVLRHTFRSHLAMRGAPARAIQELAGHQELGTTQRYMHLSPAAIESAIRLLDGPAVATSVAQGNAAIAKFKG
jgi:integrase